MAFLDDFLRANPQYAQMLAMQSPSIGTMPIPPGGIPRPDAGFGVGLMPIAPGTTNRVPPTPVPSAPMPMPGAPPPQGNVYHPNRPGIYKDPNVRNMYNTEFVRDYVSPLLPQGEYQSMLNKGGLGNADTRIGQYGLSQFANAQRDYQAAQLRDPGLSFRNFLASSPYAQDIKNKWMGLSAASRGLNPQSRSSVVAWG